VNSSRWASSCARQAPGVSSRNHPAHPRPPPTRSDCSSQASGTPKFTRFAQHLGTAVFWGDAATPITSGADALLLCKQYIDRQVDGIFFAPIESISGRERWNEQIAQAFAGSNIPLVLLDRDLGEFPSRSNFDLIGIDNVAAGLALTEHLINLGRRRICFVARPHYPSTTDLRLLGCREAVRRYGSQARYRMAHFGDPADQQFVATVLKTSTPDAIVCSNDQTAAILIRTLGHLKRSVPEDIAVVGFDDVEYATLLTPSLTTVRQPCRDISRTAVRTLLQRIEDPQLPPRHIQHPAEVVIRQSCGAQLGAA
jgi:DNA-binding LacI/PurR family transcriptional regulator